MLSFKCTNGQQPQFDIGCGGATQDPLARVCPGGYYCPNSTSKITCPAGHYCRPGSFEPHPCDITTHCPANCERPSYNYGQLLAAILSPIGCLLLFQIPQTFTPSTTTKKKFLVVVFDFFVALFKEIKDIIWTILKLPLEAILLFAGAVAYYLFDYLFFVVQLGCSRKNALKLSPEVNF